MVKSLSFTLLFISCVLVQHLPRTSSLLEQRQPMLAETVTLKHQSIPSTSAPEDSTSPSLTPPPNPTLPPSTMPPHSTTPPPPFAPGRSIRIANTGVGSWREISLSRVGPAPLDASSSGSYATGHLLLILLGCFLLSVGRSVH